MKYLSLNKLLVVGVLVVAVGLAFSKINGFVEEKTQPNIIYVQPAQPQMSFSGTQTYSTKSDKRTSYSYSPKISSQFSESPISYQPISKSSYALPSQVFGSFSTTSETYSVVNVPKSATARTSSVVQFSSPNVNLLSITSLGNMNNQIASVSSSQLVEPFSDGEMSSTLSRLPGTDPGEPFPDPAIPVGDGLTFLCICAFAYTSRKMVKRVNVVKINSVR